ncbi:MAG: BrnT family toxin [Caulobacteraceae bacterium]
MEIEFDPAKNARNVAERGLAFSLASDFDFATALVWSDTRNNYGEDRMIALGLIEDRLHALVYVETDIGIRVISLRKANTRERDRYAQTT